MPSLNLHVWLRIGIIAFLVLGFFSGNAQNTGKPAPPKKASPPPAAPSNQLAPQKMEEALRMLLKADSVASQRQRANLGPESTGLVVDETITKIGHDFYDQFYSHWEAPPGNADYIIVIGERPSRGGFNALVVVVVNEEELLEIPLQSKPEIIEDAALQSVEIAANSLQEARNLSQQLERGNKQAIEKF